LLEIKLLIEIEPRTSVWGFLFAQHQSTLMLITALNGAILSGTRLERLGMTHDFFRDDNVMPELPSQRKEALFQMVMENVADYAIFTTDMEGTITSWNLGVEHLLGYKEVEFVGQNTSLIFTQEDLEEGAPEHERQQVRSNGRAEDQRWHVRHDGTLFWANGMLMPLKNDDNQLCGFAKILRDDTARKQMEDELHQRAEELEKANRIKEEFLAVLSHELRTPLTAILGWSRLLHSGELDAKLTQRALESIERNAQAQTHLISDLLDVSRIMTGKLHIEPRDVELNDVVRAAVSSIEPAALAKEINLQVELDTQASPVHGDANRLQQVVSNLLTNAVKFTPKGGDISVQSRSTGCHVELAIQDSGIGIEPDFLPHVFERFRQSDVNSKHRHGGLGLGLSLVCHLVQLHGGSVRVESAGRNQGSTFTVHLPLQNSAAL
jgi:PAS domain S-box-containing protein